MTPTRISQSAAIILIVEDEEPIAMTLAMIVEDYGCLPMIAKNGEDALRCFQEQEPNLILTDLMMPKMNGNEFIAILRARTVPGRALPPIVLMSAAESGLVSRTKADAFLPKPFDIDDVEALLMRFVGHSRAAAG